jgi:peroxiredoxin
LPELETIYKENKDKGFIVIGIANTDDAAAVKKVVEEKQITFPILLTDGKVSDAFKGEGSPETFVISREGNVVDHIKGARDEAFFKSRAEQLMTKNN